MVTTLLIVRHAQTVGNLERVFQGRIDLPVSTFGEKQLALLTKRFADLPIDRICTSPLPRAVKTAEAIAAAQPVPIELVDALTEIFAGDFEGKPWDDLPVLYPEAFHNWRTDWAAFVAPNGESCKQVYDRVSRAASDIAARYPGQTVAVVSHGCAIRNLLCWAHGWDLSHMMDLPLAENTSVSRIDFAEDGTVSVVWFNDASHLEGADLPKVVLWKNETQGEHT